MKIDRYLRRTKCGGWKLRLSYSLPNKKADRVEIGLNTRDLNTARIAAVAIVNSLHAINARNKHFMGLIRPMDKESLSCTKKALKTSFRDGGTQLTLKSIEIHFEQTCQKQPHMLNISAS